MDDPQTPTHHFPQPDIYTTLDVFPTLLPFQHALRLLLELSCLLQPENYVTNLEVAQNGQKTVASDWASKVWDKAT